MYPCADLGRRRAAGAAVGRSGAAVDRLAAAGRPAQRLQTISRQLSSVAMAAASVPAPSSDSLKVDRVDCLQVGDDRRSLYLIREPSREPSPWEAAVSSMPAAPLCLAVLDFESHGTCRRAMVPRTVSSRI